MCLQPGDARFGPTYAVLSFFFSAPGPKVDDSKKLWLLIAIATGSTVFVLAVVVIAIVAVTKKRQDKLIYLTLHVDAMIRVHT